MTTYAVAQLSAMTAWDRRSAMPLTTRVELST
jgi:hypothetical protein